MFKAFSIWILLLGSMICGGTSVLASEQSNVTSDEQSVIFRLIDKNPKVAHDDHLSPRKGLSSIKKGAPTIVIFGKRWHMLPKTNDTNLVLLSFIGTLLVGLVLLIFWRRRRKQDEEETKKR